MKKIANNPSVQGIRDSVKSLNMLKTVFNCVPFGAYIFPEWHKAFESMEGLAERVKILEVPDRFNEAFSKRGWIAYESMNLKSMVQAIEIAEEEGYPAAEEFLANTYDDNVLKFGIMRCNGQSDFRKRVRLLELAASDYLAGRYHACVPLLLALIDGLANDVSKHIGFFAEGAKLTAWDSIAAHETGLKTLAKIMGLPRKRTNEDEISIPFRNGILHGRELAFDNRVVAAKCWGTLFALRDWATALANSKIEPQAKAETKWSDIIRQISKTQQLTRALEAWRPRSESELTHIPSDGPPNFLPEGTPEQVVASFLDNWVHRRYAPMAAALVDLLNRPIGKRAGLVRQEFGKKHLSSYRIISVVDKSAAMSNVLVKLQTGEKAPGELITLNLSVQFSDVSNELAVWKHDPGTWKILQNGFRGATS